MRSDKALRRRNELLVKIVVFVPIGISCLHFANTFGVIALLRATLDSRGEIVERSQQS